MKFKILLFFIIALSTFVDALAQQTELKFEHITSENGLPQNTIHGIIKDKYGFMWFGTWSGLCRYDGYRFKVYTYDKSNPHSIINNRIHNIVKDKNNDLWILTFNDSLVLKYNYLSDDFDRIPVAKVPVKFLQSMSRFDHYRTVSVNYSGTQWRIDSASNSLIQTNLKTKASKVIGSNPSVRWSLNDSYVADIYLDNQNIFWVGTYGNGINKANLNSKPFNYFNHDPQNNKSVIDDNINALCKDKSGNFWIGTRNKGISVIREGKSTVHIQHKATDKQTIGSDQIRKIFCDSRGFVWIGHKDGLDRFSPGNYSQVKHFNMLDLPGNAVYGICEDDKGDIWFATWRGLYKFLYKQDAFVKISTPQTVPLLKSRVILQDNFGQIWVGTDGSGLYQFNEKLGQQIQLVNKFDEKVGTNTISDNRIYSLFEDIEHKIWIGTGNGLDRYNPIDKTFSHFKVGPGGLSNSTISAILQDDKGNLWVSHKKGISEIRAKTFKIINYTPKDGLQSNEFVEDAAFNDKASGMLYFGGTSGYNSFVPGEIFPDTTSARIVLTELQVLNKPVDVNEKVNGRIILSKPLYLSESLSLGYRDRSFAIEFAGLHYAAPEGNKYAYMLEGFDKEWIYTDANRRIASYSNLEPGNYIFKVKGTNSDGIWNMRGTFLKISITPPFWMSAWAYLIYALALGTAAYIYHYYSNKLARIRTKLSYEMIIHEKENELHQSKLDFFTNISHEIKTPLSLILAPIESLLKIKNSEPQISSQLFTMKNNGDRLLDLINQLLDFRRLETGNDMMVLENGDLQSLIEGVVNSFKQAAVLRGINLKFTSSIPNTISRFDSDKISKILFNLLSNALKFTADNGLIEVKLDKSVHNGQEFIGFSVTDNGSGIPKEELQEIFKPFNRGNSKSTKGTGLGLAYVKSLVEQYKGTIDVESLQSINGLNMTTFSVKLPWNNPAGQVDNRPELLQNLPNQDFEELDVLADSTANPETRSRILLIEDNTEMRLYLKNYLKEKYLILEASNGKEGLQISAKQSLDLVISDVMMPEMDGLEFCRILKNDENTSHIPIILLTARTLLELQLEGLGVGADDYITKPFNLDLLALKINNILQSKARLRERYQATVVIEPSNFNPVTPDEKLLKKLLEYIEDNLSDPDLSVDDISEHIFVSKTQLYRKTKALTGLTTVDLIRQMRLKRAKKLLEDKNFNINEITYMVGFTDANYFRKCFKNELGVSPSEYVRQKTS
ncbi:two-component regulator propeller domain-containing protein [Pedobacter jejuensis]|uniref:histidine kinase n=1 Tax=Pedobacter jejuensis TaxID=1268550 RepID=A0A3N0BT08_9SPHI|nr:two-component regulator propeller domain-containing protein [Pedobacter jejuensis]RNL52186.1 response regulator [Pedobacter jejuensis]